MLFLCVVWSINLCGRTWMVHFGRGLTSLFGVGIFQGSKKAADTHANWLMDNDDSGPGAQWEAPDLHEKLQKMRHILMSFDEARRWLRDETGSLKKISYGGRVLRNASAMTAEREALRMGIGHLTVLFPTEVSSFDFEVENSGRQYSANLMRSLCVSSVFTVM